MRSLHDEVRDEQFGRLYEYDDRYVAAFDVGAADESVAVDAVGRTLMVVVETGDDPVEREFELPGEAETIETNNGVVTVTVQK